ncbi:MAG: hypothetical protein HKN02_14240 [Rhodobacteraceae bacterium]|nr:hypothetical protein [Paracoccaceae bacterium]
MNLSAASGIVLAAGASVATAQGDPSSAAQAVIAACLAEGESPASCAGRAEQDCLETSEAYAHAPNPNTRREWCVRAETRAFLALFPGSAIPWQNCALEDVEAASLRHLEEAICARDALIKRLEAEE